MKSEPYQGVRTVSDVHGVGIGGSLSLDLISKLCTNKPSFIITLLALLLLMNYPVETLEQH